MSRHIVRLRFRKAIKDLIAFPAHLSPTIKSYCTIRRVQSTAARVSHRHAGQNVMRSRRLSFAVEQSVEIDKILKETSTFFPSSSFPSYISALKQRGFLFCTTPYSIKSRGTCGRRFSFAFSGKNERRARRKPPAP